MNDVLGYRAGLPRRLLMIGACWLPIVAWANEAAAPSDRPPLPSPLTLEQALAFAEQSHPDLALAQARREAAQAGYLLAQSQSGTRAWIDLLPQTVDPVVDEGSHWVNDNAAHFVVNQPLYDFGRTASLKRAARAIIVARDLDYLNARQARRLEIMQRFFDVLLADLRYAVDNENMALQYVTYDKGRERHSLGQISDVELLEQESAYQDAFIKRTDSQMAQSSTRAALAIALNRPGELPGDLQRPALTTDQREIPEYQVLLEAIRKTSPRLKALQQEVTAARETVAAEQARRRPVLGAELQASAYEREFGSRDNGRATLNLRIPLYQGKRDSAAITQAVAVLHEKEAQMNQAVLALHRTVLDLTQTLESLKVQRRAAKVRVDYRDLSLDRSRALYEMEVQTTLGDAMTRVSEAQWQAARVEFTTALTWATIDAMQGTLIPSPTQEQNP